jgi:hypothetical protein
MKSFIILHVTFCLLIDSCDFPVWLILPPSTRRQFVPSKCWFTYFEIHGVICQNISQKLELFREFLFRMLHFRSSNFINLIPTHSSTAFAVPVQRQKLLHVFSFLLKGLWEREWLSLSIYNPSSYWSKQCIQIFVTFSIYSFPSANFLFRHFNC